MDENSLGLWGQNTYAEPERLVLPRRRSFESHTTVGGAPVVPDEAYNTVASCQHDGV